MCGIVEAIVISAVASTAIGAATQPDVPDIPAPEKPTLDPAAAAKSAERRRRSTSKGGRPSTVISGSPLGGPQAPPPTGSKTLTGY